MDLTKTETIDSLAEDLAGAAYRLREALGSRNQYQESLERSEKHLDAMYAEHQRVRDALREFVLAEHEG